MTTDTGMTPESRAAGRAAALAVLVAALGYFVDVYDLLLFSIIRVKSLESLGLRGPLLLDRGVLLLNMQMGGMIVGGVLWGVLGDKRGRLSVLFGSIILYSSANIANGFVQNVTQYAIVRFIAGVGLAGELGAGITLVSELMRKESRGYGTSVVATIGIFGAVVASIVGAKASWRTAYFIGGSLGWGLLLLRVGVLESGLFASMTKTTVKRGDVRLLFASRPRIVRYLSVIAIGLPIWYAMGILVTLSPEIGRALGMNPAPTAGQAVFYAYLGLACGDLSSGLLSQLLRSRKRVVAAFLGLTALSFAAYFVLGRTSLVAFYACCAAVGVATGYWAVFITMASEQFGTNLRATVTTTAPNFVRGAVVPMTLLFQRLKGFWGVTGSALAVGVLALVLAAVALRGLGETYGRDLDFTEV